MEETEKWMDVEDCKLLFPIIEKAELAGDYFGKYITFTIAVSENQRIIRSFNDFEWLREWLVAFYPCTFIPFIPPTLPIAIWPPGYTAVKQHELNQFIQRCTVIPYLRDEEIVRYFLNPKNDNFENAKKNWLSDHKKPSYRTNYNTLKNTFPFVVSEQISNNYTDLYEDAKRLAEESTRHTETLINEHKEIIDKTTPFLDAMQEFNVLCNEFCCEPDGVKSQVCDKHYFSDRRVNPVPGFEKLKTRAKDEVSLIEDLYLPCLGTSFRDLFAMHEIFYKNEQIQGEYAKASHMAERWKNVAQELTSDQLSIKQQDIEQEYYLRNLAELVAKLSLNQFDLITSSNMRRWNKYLKRIVPAKLSQMGDADCFLSSIFSSNQQQ